MKTKSCFTTDFRRRHINDNRRKKIILHPSIRCGIVDEPRADDGDAYNSCTHNGLHKEISYSVIHVVFFLFSKCLRVISVPVRVDCPR